MTPIGVQQYVNDLSSLLIANASAAGTNTTVTIETNGQKILASWALWVSLALLFLLFAMGLWGYKQDKRDEINIVEINNPKHKLYIGVCLDPIEYEDKQQEKEL